MPGRMDIADRLAKHSIPVPWSGCWLWLGDINPSGYAKMTAGYVRSGDRKTVSAHRLSYEHFVGPIPPGFDINHLCRVRCCVNPLHLEPRSENTRRGVIGLINTTRAALMTHCLRGHPLSGDNLRLSAEGRRICRTCKTVWGREHRKKRRSFIESSASG